MMDNLAYSDCINPRREEMHDGKLIAMAPAAFRHNRVAGKILSILDRALKGKPCEALGDGYGLFLDDENYVIPDGMIVCDKNKLSEDGVRGAPDLVVEVLSPSSRAYDRGYKKNLYSRHGVKEYWIADPIGRYIEVYLQTDKGLEISETYEIYPDYTLKHMTEKEKAALKTEVPISFLPGITLPLEEIFANPFD
jgi:Uma2 family endonuclease